jgi:hypothetical protein
LGLAKIRFAERRHSVTYTGTLVKDLQTIVDICLRWNERVCAICGQCYGAHSELVAHCPSSAREGPVYLQTIFLEQRCEEKARPRATTLAMKNANPGMR